MNSHQSVAKHSGRDQRLLVFFDPADALKKVVQRARFKELFGPLFRHRRAKRPELLAMLYKGVQIVAHHFSRRRSQYAASAQTARAKLHRASEPSHDFSLRELAGYFAGEFVFSKKIFISKLTVVEHAFDFVVGESRPKKRVLHFIDPLTVAHHLMPNVERCSNRAAGITGGGLNKKTFESRASFNRGVCKTVERNAPG